MITHKKISIAFIFINLLGIVFSLLYGVLAGSGGETTQGVYLGFFYTNLASILFVIIIAIIRFSWWRSNFVWIILVLLIYYPVTSVVIANKINNIRTTEPENADFGMVQQKIYIEDKGKIESYLIQKGMDVYTVDTLLYSKNLLKVLVVASFKESSGLYRNFELFAQKKQDMLLIKFPKGGNLIAEDTNKQVLVTKVIKWYVNTYSIKEEYENNLWTYQDFWGVTSTPIQE